MESIQLRIQLAFVIWQNVAADNLLSHANNYQSNNALPWDTLDGNPYPFCLNAKLLYNHAVNYDVAWIQYKKQKKINFKNISLFPLLLSLTVIYDAIFPHISLDLYALEHFHILPSACMLAHLYPYGPLSSLQIRKEILGPHLYILALCRGYLCGCQHWPNFFCPIYPTSKWALVALEIDIENSLS